MNRYGRLALEHWTRYQPSRLAQIEDPQTYFASLGEQIHEQVMSLSDELLTTEPESQDYLARMGQMSAARNAAEEIVLNEMVFSSPEPMDEDQTDDPTAAVMDAQGMPLDRSHPLWEAMDDDTIEPETFRAMLQAWQTQVTTGRSRS